MSPTPPPPVDVALIGCGRIVETGHLPVYLADPGIRVVAVCDPSKRRRDVLADRLGVPDRRRFVEPTELGAPEVTATVAVVASPTATHRTAIEAALAAGLHVVSEKPVTPDSATARELVDHAASLGRRITVLHNYLTTTGWRAVYDTVTSGILGTARVFRIRLADPGPLPGFHPTHGDWRTDRALAGGGCLLDQGYHYIYLSEALLGPISRVAGAKLGNTTGWTVEDRADVVLEHVGGGCTELSLDWSVSDREPPLHELTCERGTVELDEDAETVTVRVADEPTTVVDASFDPDGYRLALPAAIRAVSDGTGDLWRPGLRVVRILDDCYRAAGWGDPAPIS
ncbi:putative dehydrogenase [Stackebrandtia endophytica]|uniref:Putative dehydrogenase n=1 Tax=Stackebrandtia endophytica TaxID=1496996 RepID=A0A543AZ83_9ACTN|nr:Gfo/Idh/MocA family oxidoreductase [Stackebrandtia endophytica]TQL77891.1 putative dehydrogenase [Stackebrandtia endophytica]